MRISKFFISAAVALVLLSACTPTYVKQTNQAISDILEEFQAVGISAAVVKDGKIIYNESFGYKDLERQALLCNDDVMRIASISKSFTSTALMQFVEKGIISLDDDVSDLVGFKIHNPHHPDIPITLRMILSHTSSIRDKADYSTLDHLNPAVYGDCAESYSEYKPGEGYRYSNIGTNLAGAILEKVSGQRFDSYIRDNIISKLGLYGGHNVDSLDAERFARIYRLQDGEYVESKGAYASRAADMPNYKIGYSAPIFSPAGGVKISARDLAKYMMMHMNYGEYNGIRIISEQSAKLMQTPVEERKNDNQTLYALCLSEFTGYVEEEKYNEPENYLIGHTGGAYGLSSIMLWSPADGWGIVAMTNGHTPVEGKNFLKSITSAIYDACIRE